MRGDLSPIDETLTEHGTDAYLIEASSDVSDQAYLSGFWAPDAFVTLYVDGAVHCLVSPLEFGRAQSESLATSVANVVEFDYFDRLEELERHEAWGSTIADFCARFDVTSVSVPGRFPLSVAEVLRDEGITVMVDTDGVVSSVRAVKTEPELEAIADAQEAAQAAMSAAENLLTEAAIADDGTLELEGETLTSERLKFEIELTLLEARCALDDTIVACGSDAADPHDRGSGPLHAGETIIIDIFPRHKESRYHGDFTRTFVKGEASDELHDWYELTSEALDAALGTIQAGVTGEQVHDAVCDVYEAAGHATLRAQPTTSVGFIHSTGHGVGLDVHEGPSLSTTGEELEVNHVITVEPGLYDPEVGGVRIEDMVVVTEGGYHNLTDYPRELVID